MKRKSIYIVLIFFVISLIATSAIMSSNLGFELIELESVSRYTEDRIAYQQINLNKNQANQNPNMDNAVSCLLIIRDKKMYLIKDGYDNSSELKTKRMLLELEGKIVGNLSFNPTNSKPDYIRITERRVEVLKKINEEFVEKNFGKFFTNVRDEFLKKHVAIFRNLMVSRGDTGISVKRVPLPIRERLGANPEERKFAIYVTAKSIDDKVYYAEDADGNGKTETFYVSMNDGFNWGYKSGPNIVCIYQNEDPEIDKIIGDLAKEAYYGTPKEEDIIKADMDRSFRRSASGKIIGGQNWDDREIIDRWMSDIVPPEK